MKRLRNALPSPAALAPVIEFDNEYTHECANVNAGVRLSTGADYTVLVDLQVYPPETGEMNVLVSLTFRRFVPGSDAEKCWLRTQQEDFEISEHELAPLVAGLTRALAACKARGFIPTVGAGA